MAIFKTEDTKGKKEDLASFISMITRDETPFLSSISNKKATSVFHEWQTDSLAAPVANANAEGSDFDINAVSAASTVRIGNYSQILSKHMQVSKTLDSVSKAGRNSEFAYQMKKKGTELKRDLEYALVGTRQVTLASGGRSTDGVGANAGRSMGGVQSFVPGGNTWNAQTSAFGNGSTADGSAVSANPTNVVDGTPVTHTLDLTDVDNVMQKIYEEGGKASVLMMSPSNKRAFSALAQAGGMNTRRNIDEKGSLRQSVELYESDFGLVKVVPNYIQGLANNFSVGSAAVGDGSETTGNAPAITLTIEGASDVIVYDPSWWSMATLRPLHTADIGVQGDATTAMLIEETTLECRNPLATGLITNIGTFTQSTGVAGT
jgi:hypothetical protein